MRETGFGAGLLSASQRSRCEASSASP